MVVKMQPQKVLYCEGQLSSSLIPLIFICPVFQMHKFISQFMFVFLQPRSAKRHEFPNHRCAHALVPYFFSLHLNSNVSTQLECSLFPASRILRIWSRFRILRAMAAGERARAVPTPTSRSALSCREC